MPVTHGVASSSLVRTANKREQRGFDNIEASLVFMLFHLQKIWLFASCSVRRPPDYRQSKSVLLWIMPNNRIFKLLLTFADVNTLKSSICTYNATLPIVYWLRLFFLSPKSRFVCRFAFDNAFFGKIDCNGFDCSFRFAYVCGDFFLCCFWSFLQEVQHCNLFQSAIQSAKFALWSLICQDVWRQGNQHGFWIAGFVGWLVFYLEII